MPVEKSYKKKVVEEMEIDFCDKELIGWLLRQNLFNSDKGHISIEAVVRVPGGGDWSNKELTINEDCPLIFKVKKTTIQNESTSI